MNMQKEQKYSETERKAGRQYMRELWGTIAIYGAILIPSVTYGPTMDAGLLKTLVLVCPMIGFFLMIWAVARQVNRMD
jgi:peptidoglycan/LPS O-acetylase OafA/YrhL